MAGCRVLTRDEISRVLEAADPKTRLLVLTGLTFGTRISEALQMTFGDVGNEWVTIRALKKGKIQTYPVPGNITQAVEILRQLYIGNGVAVTGMTPLFLGIGSHAMSRQNASQQLKILMARLNITGRVNSHSFRKNFITAIYEKTGKDLAQTRIYSRHASLGSLQYYIETSSSTGLVNNLGWS